MFFFDVDKEQFGFKFMNCLVYVMMFCYRECSYKEFFFCFVDFGVFYCNEVSGVFSGFIRVRRFQQDDVYIFCCEDQIKEEVVDFFDFMCKFYGIFGFIFKFKFFICLEKFFGEIEIWDCVEFCFKEVFDEFVVFDKDGGVFWEFNFGDGVFYGFKIDIVVLDCFNRLWQCVIIQFDFQQFQNFFFEYQIGEVVYKGEIKVVVEEFVFFVFEVEVEKDKDGKEKKKFFFIKKVFFFGCVCFVMIYCVMVGSIECFIVILVEYFVGKWLFWMLFCQVIVIFVGMGFLDYVKEVVVLLKKEKFYVGMLFFYIFIFDINFNCVILRC